MKPFCHAPGSRASGRSTPRHTRLDLEVLEDRTQLSGLIGLGAASSFAVLEINGGNLTLNSSHLVGNVGLGPNATSVLQKTDVTGTFVADPSAQVDLCNYGRDFTVSGGIVYQSLSQAVNDANAASVAYAGLIPTQSFGNLTSSITVVGNGGTNVIAVASLAYNGKTLTLSGGANDIFVFNVSGGFSFYQSQIALAGGVTANHVLFNFPTAGPTIDLSKSTNVVNGTFLAPQRDLIYHNPASFTGAIIAHNINIHSNANLTGTTYSPPSSLSGFVYVDAIFDGERDAGEAGIGGVIITLTGIDNLGNAVNLTVTTDTSGFYSFTNLRAGTYSIAETQPGGFLEGATNVGSQGGTASTDLISAITLNSGVFGVNNNFGELLFAGS